MTTATVDASAAPARLTTALRPVRLWLFVVAGLIVAMVLVGGATRLTGSGLSITEWAPVTGAIPPLSESAWASEFEKYRATPQYVLVNKGMTLREFKSIYLWEWGHRFLGRLIGIVFLVPLLVFIGQGRVRGRIMAALLAVGAFGGVQGAVGWIMVASGLAPDMVAVAPVKLMLHLILACGLLVAVLAIAISIGNTRFAAEARLRAQAAILVGLVLAQVALGALVAGHHAGLIYNTWPLMGGAWVPPATTLFPLEPWWLNFFETAATAQFFHRVGAYVLFAFAAIHAVTAIRKQPGTRIANFASVVLALIVAQAALGIATLLLEVPLWAALAHQGLAVVVLVVATAHWRRIADDSGSAAAEKPAFRPA
jgi:cytochrome c oxidase assembly protein subunit 15